MNLGQWSGHQVFDLRTENCWPETQAALVLSCLLSAEIVDTVNYTVIVWWREKNCDYITVCVCMCLPCSLLPQPDWLIHWQHTCFNALLIKFSTDPSSEIKHKQDSVSARRGQKSEAYLEGINNAFEILSCWSIYSWWAHRRDSITSAVLLSRKFYNSSRSNLLEMHKYAISGQTIITNNYQFVVCHASLKFILSIWSYLDQYIVCTHCTIKC